jgi:DNA-binding CsgD family transcriptional regulator
LGRADQVDLAIRRIYAAAADFALWPEALSAIEEVTGSVGAVIDFVPRGRQAPMTLAGRFTSEQCATFSRDYQHLCRRIAFAIEHPEVQVACDELHTSETEMDRDPVYNWLGQHGLRYYLGSHLSPTDSHYAYWSVQRSPRQGHAQKEDVELFAMLGAHMSQAVGLADKLGTLKATAGFTLGLLDALPQAIFAIGAALRISFANRAAEALLLRADGISSHDARLALDNPGQQQELDRLLHGALDTTRLKPGGWMRVDRPSGRRAYALFVSRLEASSEAFPHEGPAALVVVHEPERALAIDPEALRRLYDLTEAEARLAVALADGHSIVSASAALKISPGTARVHLKAVFRKTGTNRQQDLIRMIAALA